MLVLHSNQAESAVERLATLSRLEYDRVRQGEAERLNVRVGTLDAEVATARGGTGSGRLQGRALELATPEPATEPVDGAALLDALAAAASHHVALPEHADTVSSLWAVHTHAVVASSITPRLTITSPTMRCGKSTLLRLLAMVVRKPLPAENVTPAALFRTIEKAQPTLLIDEADSFLSRSDDLRGLLNSGHWRGSQFLRTVGDDHDPRVFATFAPVAIASIGKLLGTIQDRSVIISMRRRRPDEKIKRLRIKQQIQYGHGGSPDLNKGR